ncbi:N-formylglutamate amidohydrolase [Mesorhizobium sp. CO1-1-7]|uniref:Putative N-formylglutamate amidohydrolase n=1 Tax=Mesorhizobium australicum (strain HAMBI 3006 / LMG 24608 / WSM2073) TaxID=754035 RepID=L0KKE9_MESAW|nr:MULTISPECIES: N-formylglutamate amidohydrolase [Mesorhizobium]MBZ9929867.1 N-formylglutamate amidohydrolase [Mesorhizobium sp. BR1-1-5]AGB45040.1 putative N-formylglutamate amidohydrolase [Mesorhizobium australicum WSM2073]MBZ9743674.1 N-formylglutamate amidohydrolase [Mesorhizobium sp. CO1-1-7]MBZ9907915.1 N-formylglutamate amidohydrolase [Mesorhizobium sp. BR115XR7A]MBZ9976605.1 N-formylglutamate amidohydrolase [Mesorhizobium sp. BR-1-1-10]
MTAQAEKSSRPQEDWPEAVEVLNEHGRCEIVLLCEHASNHMPAEYRRLGLDASHLQRHIAWDIGAAEVTRLLSARLDAAAFLSGYSRLLIDLNRPLGSLGSIPVLSEDTDIPGNAGVDGAERDRRAEIMFSPFHERVAAHLDRRVAEGRPTRIVTIHSFTPVFLGVARPWHAGVLHGHAADLAAAILSGLRTDAALNVAANVPYVISRDADYAVPIHGDDRGIPAVLVEIRQDLLSTRSGIKEWADRLAAALPAHETEASQPVRR